MKIEPKDIGNYVNKFVWICDYRYNDYLQKPIRKVLPQKVIVLDNYYNEYYFCCLNKNDKPLMSKIIKIYDNTGYRGYKGVPLNIFDNKEECYECFYEQCSINHQNITKETNKIIENSKKICKDIWELKEKYSKFNNNF